MKNKPLLSIILLNYNVEQLLLDCLASLAKAKTPSDNWEVIVADNGSTDNSVVLIKKLYPKIKLIENKRNLGFAAGNNVAIKQAKGEYILLLNCDTLIYPQTIQTVYQFMQAHPEVGAATCRVELPDGTLDYSCHRRFPNPYNAFIYFYSFFFKHLSDYSDSDIPDKPHEIDALTGAFALIRRSAGDQVNWLDEDYFWNGEDLDFCYKLKSAGWKIYYLPQIKITHFKGSSSGIRKTGRGNASRDTKIRSALSGTKAMRLFYHKHLEAQYPILVNWLVYTGILLLQSLRLIKVYWTFRNG